MYIAFDELRVVCILEIRAVHSSRYDTYTVTKISKFADQPAGERVAVLEIAVRILLNCEAKNATRFPAE